jgi:MFS superfamily sulfate permease-like transporter
MHAPTRDAPPPATRAEDMAMPRPVGPPSRSASWLDDLFASVVVVLVALPLCLGIALASGVPPALGLVTGLVGGLIVGFLQGSPVSVSGPAAGLTVLVAEVVREGVLAAGLLQFVAGLARRGRWSRAVPPSLVHGMLAGIGLLIIAGQVHVMVGASPRASGLGDLLAIPRSLGPVFLGDGPHTGAALVGLVTIAVLLAWRRWARGRVGLVPPRWWASSPPPRSPTSPGFTWPAWGSPTSCSPPRTP